MGILQLSFGDTERALQRILCLGAHCDDIEIGCGGMLRQLLGDPARPVEVQWVVLSSTDERSREARASADRFLAGARSADVRVETFRDGYFPYCGGDLKDYFEALKADAFEPDLILTHYGNDRHQDHRLVSELTWNTFRNHLVLEYEIPKYDGDLGQPNFYLPLSEKERRDKIEFLLDEFPSQRTHPWFDAEMFNGLMRVRGMECNAASGYAEAFYARKLLAG